MPKIPGMHGDVYFGATNELPDWRNEPFNEGEDATPEEREGVVRILGFDPADMTKNSAGKWVRKGSPADDSDGDGENED